MLRILYSIMMIVLTLVFGWWIFFPLALIYVYLAKLPYEIIIFAALLDNIYYFGDGFFRDNMFSLFSILLILVAFFLGVRINWQRKI